MKTSEEINNWRSMQLHFLNVLRIRFNLNFRFEALIKL